MTILFFDTETTGFYNFKQPADHASQPYLVQLAAQLCGDDGDILAQLSMIVNSGVDIPLEASNVHGITTARASAYGAPVAVALAPFMHMWRTSDLVVAHNLAFDEKILATAVLRRWGAEKELPKKPTFCTMEASKPIINLPATPRMLAAGFKGPKTPNLGEAYRHFTGEELSGAHDAMVDTNACRRVYFALHAKEQKQKAA